MQSYEGEKVLWAVLYTANWLNRSLAYQEELSTLLGEFEEEGVEVCYMIESQGNDAIEDHVLDMHDENPGDASFPCSEMFGEGKEMDIIDTEDGDEGNIEEDDDDEVDSANKIPELGMAEIFRDCCDDSGFGLLFVSGDRSSVGKSTVCMSLLASLIARGISNDDIGYIKPVTQCEAEQPVVRYCTQHDIECIGIGPVVFYKGFTRAFLSKETDETSEQLIIQAVQAVIDLKKRRKFVLVDGVGYPAVGSICGVSNAHVAKALNAPVLLVGKSGVGDAVDSHNLNAAYFQYHGVTVLGSIFNKLSLEGFYSLESCKQAIESYFQQYGNGQRAYGFLPLIKPTETEVVANLDPEQQPPKKKVKQSKGENTKSSHTNEPLIEKSPLDSIPEALSHTFDTHVDVDRLLYDVYIHNLQSYGTMALKGHGLNSESPHNDIAIHTSSTSSKQQQLHTSTPILQPPTQPAKRSRQEIEAVAKEQGARGG